MPRLPRALEPAFPLVKRAHRAGTRAVGRTSRAVARRSPGPTRLPHIGTTSSRETARLEPEAVTFHPGGPAQTVVRPMPTGNPPNHPYFAERLITEIPPRFTLEIAEGTVVGTYGAHITPGGILDYETSDYFGIKGWHEHPLYLRTRLPEAEYVDGTLLSLGTRGTWGNYYHVLMDLLPRWGFLQDAMPGVEPDVIFANQNTGYARELLAMVGLDRFPMVEPTKHGAFRARRLLVPALPNYGNVGPPDTVAWLRANLPTSPTGKHPKRLFITRGNAKNTRRLENEDEILAILKPLGFEVFDPGQHTVREQHDHFAAAEVVVAVHGAGNVNLVFAPPGVRVLELFAPRYVDAGYWTILHNIPESKYRYLVGGNAVRGMAKPQNKVMQDIHVDPDEFRAALADLLA